MSGIWTTSEKGRNASLSQLGLEVSAFERIEGFGYASAEPASHKAVVILGRNGSWQTHQFSGEEQTAAAFACGATTQPTHVKSESVDGCVEISMPPWLAFQIWPNLRDSNSAAMPLGDVLGEDVALIDYIFDTCDLFAAVKKVEAFLVRKLNDADRAQPRREIVWAWQKIMQHQSEGRVRGLADEIGWSERHFSNLFRDTTGLEPKSAMRLARFHRAYQRLFSTGESLAAIAADCGYADQSHMTRAFREFAGSTPNAVRKTAAVQMQALLSGS